MMLKIKAKAGSDESRFDESKGTAFLKSRPKNNKANIELTKLLAKHFKVSSSHIRIIRGHNSKEKLIEVIQDGRCR